MTIRFLLCGAAGVLTLLIALLLTLGSYGGGVARPVPQRAGAQIRAASEAIGGGEDGPRISVVVHYATTPTGNRVRRSVQVSSAAELKNLTPQETAGYHFYWMLDGEEWDGKTLTEGMTLTGQWVPVYQITVY